MYYKWHNLVYNIYNKNRNCVVLISLKPVNRVCTVIIMKGGEYSWKCTTGQKNIKNVLNC